MAGFHALAFIQTFIQKAGAHLHLCSSKVVVVVHQPG